MNKVSIAGIITAIILASTELIKVGEKTNYYVLAMSVVIAVLTYLARETKGPLANIIGAIAAAVAAYFAANPVATPVNVEAIFHEWVVPLLFIAVGIAYHSGVFNRKSS